MKKDLIKKIFVFALVLTVFISLSCNAYASSGTLKKGDNSQEVVKVQQMLKKLGYFEGDCTGYFGDITEKAVIAFQKDYKLTADGKVGPATLNKLTSLTAATASRSSTTSKNDNAIHTVKQGDTVWDIAKAYGVTTSSILTANNLTESSVLKIGDKLIIPGVNKSTVTTVTTVTTDKNNDDDSKVNGNSNTENTYVVKAGDSASLIAEDFGVSLAALLKLNDLTETSILQIGQVLKIPTDEQDAEYSSSQSKDTSTSTAVSKGEYLGWFDEVQYIFEKGAIATITDVATGKTFKVKRYQGHNHADVEPLTAEDTAVMKSLYGSWSWDRRSVIVSVNGRNIAGSMNGMPHGNGSISNNNFNGHFCIHFKGSKTHAGNKVDSTHQAMVKKAAGL